MLGYFSGRFEADIQVEIFHVKLSEEHQPDYEALSYVWDSTGDSAAIIMSYRNEVGESGRLGESLLTESYSRGINHPTHNVLLVTQSQSTALRYLRRPDTERVVWIDATSINQDDIEERSRKVPWMGLIYNKARRIIVWLGVLLKTAL